MPPRNRPALPEGAALKHEVCHPKKDDRIAAPTFRGHGGGKVCGGGQCPRKGGSSRFSPSRLSRRRHLAQGEEPLAVGSDFKRGQLQAGPHGLQGPHGRAGSVQRERGLPRAAGATDVTVRTGHNTMGIQRPRASARSGPSRAVGPQPLRETSACWRAVRRPRHRVYRRAGMPTRSTPRTAQTRRSRLSSSAPPLNVGQVGRCSGRKGMNARVAPVARALSLLAGDGPQLA